MCAEYAYGQSSEIYHDASKYHYGGGEPMLRLPEHVRRRVKAQLDMVIRPDPAASGV